MFRILIFLALSVDCTDSILPYDNIYSAKHLVLMWHRWYSDLWGSMGRADRLGKNEFCDVPADATLQWAYFSSLRVPSSFNANENDLFWHIMHVARHFTFYKSKMYPMLPRTAHYGFCEYEEDSKLVCDVKLNKCVSCSEISPANAVLHEACNLKAAVEEQPSQLKEGAALYRSLKTWTTKIIGNWATNEGDSCNANGRQTLAFTKIRKLFPYKMANGREAKSKTEWQAEWDLIKDKFTSSADLEKVKRDLLGFSDNDAGVNVKYCAPSTDDPQNFILNGDDKLVCDGANCVSCRNKPPPHHGTETYRFPEGSDLYKTCIELGVSLRTFTTTTTRRTTTSTRRTTTRRRW